MRLRSRYTAAPSDTVASCSSMSPPIFRRDAFSSRLLRYRDGRGDDRADIIDVPDDASGCSAAGGAGARRA